MKFHGLFRENIWHKNPIGSL
jgi:hypothetical protein